MRKNIFVSDLIFFNDTKEVALKFIKDNNLKNIEFFLEPKDLIQMEKVNFILKNNKFKKISFHGPYRYFNIDCEENQWNNFKLFFVESLIFAKKSRGEFIVLHTNETLTKNTSKEIIEKHIDELILLGKELGIKILIENVGVGGNMLYSQKEFEHLVLSKNLEVLIDIGHLLANKWNFEELLKNLKDSIVAYHIHSNDGERDSHETIFKNQLNGEQILKYIFKETPRAKLVLEYSPITEKRILLEDLKKIEEM